MLTDWLGMVDAFTAGQTDGGEEAEAGLPGQADHRDTVTWKKLERRSNVLGRDSVGQEPIP